MLILIISINNSIDLRVRKRSRNKNQEVSIRGRTFLQGIYSLFYYIYMYNIDLLVYILTKYRT